MILLKIYWIRKIDAFSDEKKPPCKHNRSCEGDKALAVELNCIQIYSDKASMREDNTTGKLLTEKNARCES